VYSTIDLVFCLTRQFFFACVCVCVCIYVLEQLITVNNEDVRDKTVEEITRLLKGKPGSSVTLVLRPSPPRERSKGSSWFKGLF
jgi:hypothetical protein